MTARGKMHLLATDFADRPSAVFENLFSWCLLCGACEQVCPRNLPITDIVSRARSRFSTFYGRRGVQKVLARSVLAHSALLEGLVKAGVSLKRLNSLPVHSGLRLRLGLIEERTPAQWTDHVLISETRDLKPGADEISYFSGCLAGYLQPSVGRATAQLLSRCGYSSVTPAGQCCCGLAAWSAGKRDQARHLARKNIQAFAGNNGPIITSCASCSSHLFSYPDLFAEDDPWHHRAQQFAERVQEFSAFFGASLPIKQAHPDQGLQVFYHDPCHLRFRKNGQAAPRALLASMGLQVVEAEDGPSCCGQGGLFHLGYPETSDRIFQKTSRSIFACQPDCITTTCSGCLMQYQQRLARQQKDIRVVHLSILLAEVFIDSKCGQ
jgi:glycolate oxidase iron-sulfur subunit